MKRLLSILTLVAGSVLLAEGVVVAEATSDNSVVDTRDTLGSKLVHGTVRISPVAEDASEGVTLLIDETAPEDWSAENPMWDSTTVADGVRGAALYESEEEPSTAELVVMNGDEFAYEGGELKGDVTWGSDAIHIVQYGVKVPEGASLTIDDGAVVKLTKGAEIIADGNLTAGNGAVFSSLAEADVPGQVEIIVDEALSETSTNPVQNKAVAEAVTALQNKDNELEGRLSTVEGKASTLEGKVSTLEGKVSTLERKDTDIINSFNALAKDVTAMKDTVAEHDTAIDGANSAISAIQTADQTRDAAIDELQKDNAELKSQLSTLLALLNGGAEGQVLTKASDGSCVWMDAKSVPETQVLTINLEVGWNLVAMPGKVVIDESEAALFSAIKIYTYDKSQQIYLPSEELEPLGSYWMYAEKACAIHFAVTNGDAE